MKEKVRKMMSNFIQKMKRIIKTWKKMKKIFLKIGIMRKSMNLNKYRKRIGGIRRPIMNMPQ